jgi:hypothetical protein
MEFILRAAAVPGLNVPQQIECTVEGAFICLRLNMHRKYAFLVYFAALLSADSENASVAHSLVLPHPHIDSECLLFNVWRFTFFV